MNFSLTNFLERITIKQLLIAFVSLFILINIPYYWNFHSFNLSKSATDWGEYGSYISGFTSFLNLFFFISLTIYVARLENKNSNTQIETQRIITELQIESQKKILQAQFRQSQIYKFNECIEKSIFESKNTDRNRQNVINEFCILRLQIKTFNQLKPKLFPNTAENIDKKLDELDIKTRDLIEHLESLQTEGNDETVNLIADLTILKNEIIGELQDYIINKMS